MVTKKLETVEDREFWQEVEGVPKTPLSEIKVLPRLGDHWWEAETELSIDLLRIRDRPW